MSKGLVTFFDEDAKEWATEEFDDFNKSLDFFWDVKYSTLMRFIHRSQRELDDVKMPVWRWIDGNSVTTENDLD
jgi:hypothetical protein